MAKQFYPPPISLISIALWAAFLLIFKAFGPQSESYYWSYLLVSISVLFLAYVLLRLGAIDILALYLPMVFLGLLEASVVVLQSTHVLSSNSTQFSVTGTGINPNIAAMTLCLTLPAAIEWAMRVRSGFRSNASSEKNSATGSLLNSGWNFQNLVWIVPLLIAVAILLTQCRSALLALIVVVGIYLLRGYRRKKSLNEVLHAGLLHRKRLRQGLLLVACALLVVAFVVLNRQKEASTSGRLTIWKLSAGMIAEKPLSGYGYGYFEKAYNLHQADYFNSAARSEAERMNGTYTGMAYNEYLEQTVMGGIGGGILFAAFLLTLIVIGWKQHRHSEVSVAPLAGVSVFALMSLFNFTVAYPVLFLFLLFYAAILTQTAAEESISGVSIDSSSVFASASDLPKPTVGATSHKWMPCQLNRKTVAAVLVVSVVVVFSSLPKYHAQKQLARAELNLSRGQLTAAGNLLRKAEPSIATSEAFYNTKARYCFAVRDLVGAREALLQVLEYTSSPYPMQDLAQVTAYLGNTREAEHYLLTAAGIEPHLFRPRMQLLELYLHSGDTLKAQSMATQIIRMKPKIDSPQVQAYKQQARKVQQTRQVLKT